MREAYERLAQVVVFVRKREKRTQGWPMQKRVLLFQNAVLGNAKSGGDTRLIKIAGFFQSSYTLSVLTTEQAKKLHEQNGNQCHFFLIPGWFSRWGLVVNYLLRTCYALFLLMKHGKNYDILYASSDLFPDVIPCFLFKHRSRMWIQVIHHLYVLPWKRQGRIVRNTLGFLAQRMSFALIKKRADKIIVVNEMVKKELLRLGMDGNKIFINSNGIEYDYFLRIQPAPSSFDCMMLGRLNYSKGILDLPKIWKFFDSPPTLGMVGEEEKEEKRVFREILAREHLEERIHILGSLEDKATFELLAGAKVFVFPSHEEGWGIAIAEAMALGLPVVAWHLPVYDYVFEDSIIKIPQGDYQAFAEAIARLLGDETMRTSMGQRGREFIKKYSWQTVAEREKAFIEALPSSHGWETEDDARR